MPGMDAMPMEMGESPGGIDKKLSGNHEQKTRFFIKPNLMQLHSSYVVTDPKGYNDVGQRKYHNNKMRYFLYPT